MGHLEDERLQHKLAMEAVDDDVARGWRSEFLYRDRFNLSAADRDLVAGDAVAPVVPAPLGGPFCLGLEKLHEICLPKGIHVSSVL